MIGSQHILRRLEVVCRESIPLPDPITGPDQVVSFLTDRHAMDMQESFFVVLLDARHHPIGYVRVSQGTLTGSLVHPREVFCVAVRECAAAIIIVHNHPTGNPLPSPEDQTVTKRLTDAGMMIGIRVLDHIIVGHGTTYSFRSHNPDFLESEVVI